MQHYSTIQGPSKEDTALALWQKFFQRVEQLEKDLGHLSPDKKEKWYSFRKGAPNLYSGNRGYQGRCSPFPPSLPPKLPEYRMPKCPVQLACFQAKGSAQEAFLKLWSVRKVTVC